MRINELRTSRTALLLNAQKLVAKKDVTTEERAMSNKMLADADLIEADIAIEERLAKAQAEDRSTGPPPVEPLVKASKATTPKSSVRSSTT